MIYEKIGEDSHYLKYRVNPKPFKVMIGSAYFGIGGIMLYFVAGALLVHFANFDKSVQEKLLFVGQIIGLAVIGVIFLSVLIFLAFLFREQIEKGMLQKNIRVSWQKCQWILKHGFSNENRFWYYLLYRVPSEIWIPKPDSNTGKT